MCFENRWLRVSLSLEQPRRCVVCDLSTVGVARLSLLLFAVVIEPARDHWILLGSFDGLIDCCFFVRGHDDLSESLGTNKQTEKNVIDTAMHDRQRGPIRFPGSVRCFRYPLCLQRRSIEWSVDAAT